MRRTISGDIKRRLEDSRGREVVFLSHCALNQNTRYQGGAFARGTMPSLAERIAGLGYGIVQVPCPERMRWGGVAKKAMNFTYGFDVRHPRLAGLKGLLAFFFVLYTRLSFDGIARKVVREMEDYIREGYRVVGFLGMDGSPSCGVNLTMDIAAGFRFHASLPANGIDRDAYNRELYGRAGARGEGIFVAALRHHLTRRRLSVPIAALDLTRERDGLSQEFPLWLEP
jgi:predicted secreted protein